MKPLHYVNVQDVNVYLSLFNLASQEALYTRVLARLEDFKCGIKLLKRLDQFKDN